MGIKKLKPQCCILQTSAILYSKRLRKKQKRKGKYTYKLEMDIQHRMDEFLPEKQFMQ